MRVQALDVLDRGELLAASFGCLAATGEKKLVGDDLHGLREIERAELGARGNVHQVLARKHLFIRKPCGFVAEYERHRPFDLECARGGSTQIEDLRRPFTASRRERKGGDAILDR